MLPQISVGRSPVSLDSVEPIPLATRTSGDRLRPAPNVSGVLAHKLVRLADQTCGSTGQSVPRATHSSTDQSRPAVEVVDAPADTVGRLDGATCGPVGRRDAGVMLVTPAGRDSSDRPRPAVESLFVSARTSDRFHGTTSRPTAQEDIAMLGVQAIPVDRPRDYESPESDSDASFSNVWCSNHGRGPAGGF